MAGPRISRGKGGLVKKNRVFCTLLDETVEIQTVVLGAGELGSLADRRFPDGFTYIVLPALSDVHEQFALQGAQIPDLYMQPTFGWVSGVDLADLGTVKPRVFDGVRGALYNDAAMIMYVALPETSYAETDIVNLFSCGDGDAITFDTTSSSVTTCRVNGREMNLADYVRDRSIDTKLPLVCNYGGSMVNVSFRGVEGDRVSFYAPVVAGMTYKLASPIGAYPEACVGLSSETNWSCNCILNYIYAGLEGQHTGGFIGPVTFGEIAYILLNQALVHFRVKSVAEAELVAA